MIKWGSYLSLIPKKNQVPTDSVAVTLPTINNTSSSQPGRRKGDQFFCISLTKCNKIITY